MVYPKTNSVLGSETLEFVRKFNCNGFIFSCGGISPEGITEANYEQSLVKKEMLKQSESKILLADHSKFNKTYLCRNYGFENIDYIITDEMPDQIYIDICNKTNTKLIIA